MPKLPKKIAVGETLEIQIAPIGVFPGRITNAEGEATDVNQALNAESLTRVAKAFDPAHELLIDADHTSDAGGSTEAYGWISAVRFDADAGLMATISLTSLGADAVSDRRYRYVSPVFAVDDPGATGVVAPTALLSVALTNQPNLPVRCVLNRVLAAQTNTVEPTKKENTMIAEKLGLSPEATEEEILAAIDTLQQRIADAEAATLNAEAEAVADEEKDKIENRQAFIKLYCQNRNMAQALLKTLRTPAAAPDAAARVINKDSAHTPFFVTRQAGDVLAVYNSLSGKEKAAYLSANAKAIAAARELAAQ